MGKAKEIVRLTKLLHKAKLAVALSRTHHDKLAEQQRRETEKLHEIAQAVRALLLRFELQAAKVDGTDVSTLIPFFSDMVGKLGALDVWISKFYDGEIGSCAREIAETILPCVHYYHPDFPFEALLDAWSNSEDGPSHTRAVGRFVDEVVERMQPELEPEPPAEDPGSKSS